LPAQGATEFRPYRRALNAIVAFVAVGGILYLLASIAVSVFAKRQVPLKGKPINAQNIDEVLVCQGNVEQLFKDLNDETFSLQGLVGKQDTEAGARLAMEWDDFSKRWHDRWSEVGQRCRFVELRDRGLGADFDRLAWAHEDLEDMKLKFAALLRNYIDEQVPHIESIRRSLEASRRGLEARKQKATANTPQAEGAQTKVN
jgi:hypothetical protein